MSIISSVDSGPIHVKPQIDINLATEAGRILYVLNKILNRAKFVGLLKNYVAGEDKTLLKNCLDANSYHFVQQACDKYAFLRTRPHSETTLSSEGVPKKTESESPETEDIDQSMTASMTSRADWVESKDSQRCDSSISKALEILENNLEVRKMICKRESEFTNEMSYFLRCLSDFKEKMVLRLTENAKQYKEKEKFLREVYEKNEKAKMELDGLEEELVITRTDANVCLIGRNILINRHTTKIEKIKQTSTDTIERRVNESEKGMVNDWKKSMILQEKLKQEYNDSSRNYENLLKEHLALEKLMRAKRSKVENQVIGWIQKFDQDIGEKQAEEEEIQAFLDKETAKMNEIRKKLDEEAEEYDELMQEKEKYEEEILEKKLYDFIINKAARRIQRTFRIYKARKLAKKTAKKTKKGKKGKAKKEKVEVPEEGKKEERKHKKEKKKKKTKGKKVEEIHGEADTEVEYLGEEFLENQEQEVFAQTRKEKSRFSEKEKIQRSVSSGSLESDVESEISDEEEELSAEQEEDSRTAIKTESGEKRAKGEKKGKSGKGGKTEKIKEKKEKTTKKPERGGKLSTDSGKQ